jgi:hypothetical protein
LHIAFVLSEWDMTPCNDHLIECQTALSALDAFDGLMNVQSMGLKGEGSPFAWAEPLL